MKVKLFCCIVVMITAVTGAGAASALDQAADLAACSKFQDEIQNTFVYPAIRAQSHGRIHEALSLYKKAVKKWRAATYEADWSKDIQTTQICESLSSEAQIMKRLRRFDEAAKLYIECCKESEKREQGNSRAYLFDAGKAYAEGNLYAKAEQVYKGIIEQGSDQDNVWAHIELADMYEARGAFHTAESELSDLLNDKKQNLSQRSRRSLRVALKDLYTKNFEKDKADEIEALLNDKHCPVCGSDANVEPIVYGLVRLPAVGFHPGGCCVGLNDPRWWCKKDKIEF